ncbi:unnamed protein product [Musa acuminata subsp. burmannicoides]
MEPIDLVPSGYRFLPTAEELLLTTSPTVAGAPPGRAVAFADVYGTEPWNLLGSDRQEGYFFAERKPKNSGGSRVDRKAGSGSWTLYKKQETVKSMVGGREMVVGRKSCLFQRWPAEELRVDDVRVRDVFVWRLRDTSSLSRQEKLALCYPAAPPSKRLRPPPNGGRDRHGHRRQRSLAEEK